MYPPNTTEHMRLSRAPFFWNHPRSGTPTLARNVYVKKSTKQPKYNTSLPTHSENCKIVQGTLYQKCCHSKASSAEAEFAFPSFEPDQVVKLSLDYETLHRKMGMEDIFRHNYVPKKTWTKTPHELYLVIHVSLRSEKGMTDKPAIKFMK